MKKPKYRPPQFELPGTEGAFNLAGEKLIEPPRPERTEPLVEENHNPTLGLTFDGEASYEQRD